MLGTAVEQGVVEGGAPYVGVANATLEVNARALLWSNFKERGTSTHAEGAGWSTPISVLISTGIDVENSALYAWVGSAVASTDVLQGVERAGFSAGASGLLPYCWAETALAARRERMKVDCIMMRSGQERINECE